MSKKSKSYSIIKKECKKYLNKNIVDILLFGSMARGKYDVKDIDICVIFREKQDVSLINALSNILENKGINAHISMLVIDEFFTRPHSLIRTLLKEGKSLLTNKDLSENLGLEINALYIYNLTSLKKSDRVKFTYLIRGRNDEGFVRKNKGYFLAPSCFVIPIAHDHEIKQILELWNVKYSRKIISLIR